MADKRIGELPVAEALDDDSLLVVEQQNQAHSIRGELVARFAREATVQYVGQAEASAEKAKVSQDAAEQSAADAEKSKDAAVGSAAEAAQSAGGAARSEENAGASAAKAEEQAGVATAAAGKAAGDIRAELQDIADAVAEDRSLAATAAATATEKATAAGDSATAAKESETAAKAALADAEKAKTAAQTAQTEAETARDEAKASEATATQKATEAEKSAETARQYSGNPPVIGADGNWQTWDAENGVYASTGKPARGEKGDRGEQGPPGKDGEGSGDMLAATYDTSGKQTDVYQYAEDKASEAVKNVSAGNVYFTDGETFQQKLDAGQLKGQDGKDGAQGPVGPVGPQGEPGPKSDCIDLVLGPEDWTDNRQTVADPRLVMAGYNYLVGGAAGRDNLAACHAADIQAEDMTEDGKMSFTCGKTPESALTVRVYRFAANEEA